MNEAEGRCDQRSSVLIFYVFTGIKSSLLTFSETGTYFTLFDEAVAVNKALG